MTETTILWLNTSIALSPFYAECVSLNSFYFTFFHLANCSDSSAISQLSNVTFFLCKKLLPFSLPPVFVRCTWSFSIMKLRSASFLWCLFHWLNGHCAWDVTLLLPWHSSSRDECQEYVHLAVDLLKYLFSFILFLLYVFHFCTLF